MCGYVNSSLVLKSFGKKLVGYEVYIKLLWNKRASTYVSSTEGKELMF